METAPMFQGPSSILNRLSSAGYAACLVGGCVRELLLGVPPQKWDVYTSAHPSQVKSCFSGAQVMETGVQPGVLTVLWEGQVYEVSATAPGRPAGTGFSAALEAELARRDFTINAIAMDGSGALIDPFGGGADWNAGVIRCVGQPTRRFQEDGLRLLRALRLSAVLGFAIQGETAAALHACRDALRRTAADAIRAELCPLLCGPYVRPVLLDYPDLLGVFWPELLPMVGFDQHNPWHCWDLWRHTAYAVSAAPPDPVVRLALLLHDVGKPAVFRLDAEGIGHFHGHAAAGADIAAALLDRLRFDPETGAAVTALVKKHGLPLAPVPALIRRRLAQLGERRFFQLTAVQRGDAMGQRPQLAAPCVAQLEQTERLARQMLDRDAGLSLGRLAVNGRDLMAAGLSPGPQMGWLLRRLLERAAAGQVANEKEALLALAVGEGWLSG